MAKTYFLSTDPFLIFTAVSEFIEQISELYGLNWGSKVAPKNGPKYYVPTNLHLNFIAVSESIEQISEL